MLCNLIAYHFAKEPATRDGHSAFLESVRKALRHVEGTYGIAALCVAFPTEIVAARKASPLILGVGDNEYIIASDASALVSRTQNVVYLKDGELVHVTPTDFAISTLDEADVAPVVDRIDWTVEDADMGGYAHFMEKEIFEQPQALENTMRGRFSEDGSTALFGGLNLTPAEFREVERVMFCACGTAWHSCLVAEHLIERYARVPVEVDYASEFRCSERPASIRGPCSSSSASPARRSTRWPRLREAKRKGYRVLAINNVVGSTIAREADGGIFQHVGPEVGVASTKTFTSQLLLGAMVALYVARMRDMSFSDGADYVKALRGVPDLVRKCLAQAPHIKSIARRYAHYTDFLFLGRLSLFPIALEGALKLKEISLHPFRGLPRRRDEARTDRPHQRQMPERLLRSAGRDAEQDRLLHAGDQRPQGSGDRHRHRGHRPAPRFGRRGDSDPGLPRGGSPDRGDDSDPAPELLHRGRAGVRRGQAAQPGQVGHGGVGMEIHPARDEFVALARTGNLIPVYADLMADFETPVSAYAKLRAHGPAYLLESVEGGERLSRYSFIGCRPRKIFACGPQTTEIREGAKAPRIVPTPADPLTLIEEELSHFRPVKLPGLPRFTGGAVGFLSYEYVTRIEPTVPAARTDELGIPLIYFMLSDSLLIFDRVKQTLRLCVNAHVPEGTAHGAEAAHAAAEAELLKLFEILREKSSLAPAPLVSPARVDVPQGNFTRAGYETLVESVKEYIRAGDIIQVVPSPEVQLPLHQDSPGPLPGASDRQSLPLHLHPGYGRLLPGGSLARSARAADRRPGRDPADSGHGPAGHDPGAGPGPRKGTLERREGTGRAPDAGRLGSQRHRAGLRVRFDPCARLHVRGALLPCHAHRFAGGRPDCLGQKRLRPDARDLSGGHGERRSQGARHADHSGKGVRPEGLLRGRPGLLRLRG